MTDKQDPIAHAARLLRETAEELRQAHAYNNSEGWENETDAKAAYDEHLAAAQALEDWEAAVGAGGVQALSAAPAGFVPVAAFDRLHAHAESLAARLLAASPTPPVEQQAPKAAPTRTALPEGWTDCTIEFGNDGPEVVAYGPKRMMIRLAKWLGKYFAQVIAEAAPKAAPGDAIDEAMRERDDAEDFIDALLDEVLGHERPEWSNLYGRADALNDVQERMTSLHKPAVDKAWGQFQSAMAAPQQEAQEPTEIPEEIERMAADRYKVVPSHESMFHRWAVVAGTGTQQLYLGREVECQNMARKFAGAFLDGAFVAMQRTAPQPAPAPLSDEAKDAMRWRETLMHIGAANHLGGQHFTLNTLRISDQMFLLRGSASQHFTKCIDESIARRAALAAQGGK